MTCHRRLYPAMLIAAFLLASNLAQGQTAFDVPSSTYHGSATISVEALQLPRNAWLHLKKAQTLAMKDRHAECALETTIALRIAPRFSEAYLLRARELMLQQDFAAAITSVDAAISADPHAQGATVILAGAYNGLHRFQEAKAVLDAISGTAADTWQAKYESARAEIGQGSVDAALKSTAIALNAAPQDFNERLILHANALVLAHRWADAAVQMQAYLESPMQQAHRQQVLIALERVRLRLRDDTHGRIALQ